jgi:predicted signal transduction protein with EAL and GGDEF domain
MIALCSSRRDAGAALEGGADDLLERPFDWRVASRRAEHLVRLAEAAGQLARLQKETERLRNVLEEERQERTWLNQFDALTGLPNGERLERALESALVTAGEKSQVAVVLFDIEHLVLINSRLGRARVNSLLQQVAQRLIAGLRSEEVLNSAVGPSMPMAARVGRPARGVLTGLPGCRRPATVRLPLDRISGRYFAATRRLPIASAGVAIAPRTVSPPRLC